MSAEFFAEVPEAGIDPSVAEYHSSRARYIRTITSDVERRINQTLGGRRDSLREEIKNLTAFAQVRHEAYQARLNAYAAKAPSRVKAGNLLSPAPADRLFAGIDALYKAAAKAAEEFREVNEIIKKRMSKLEEIDWKMRERIEEYGRALISQLETPNGLESAFKRDPLLGRAHARMVAAQNRRTSIRVSMSGQEMAVDG
jgi:hypothetical protein